MVLPTRTVIPASGVTIGRDGSTVAEPPAAVCGCSLAASPMTAMDRTARVLRGSSERAFFSSTVPSVAILEVVHGTRLLG
jgi:hypothetical protein